jgi:hypothetical protein
MTTRKKPPPWVGAFGPPIEHWPGAPREEAEHELWFKMVRLSSHYPDVGNTFADETGAWYQLAVALACELDDGFKIIDAVKPSGRTAPRWRGAEGKELLRRVECLQRDDGDGEYGAPLKPVRFYLHQLQRKAKLYPNMPLRELEARYQEARKHHVAKRRQVARGQYVTKRHPKKPAAS